MRKKSRNATILALAATMACGCASPAKHVETKHYRAPDNVAVASVRNLISPPKRGDGKILTYLNGYECGEPRQGVLFIGWEGKSTPSEPINIEAGTTIWLGYQELGPTFGMIGSMGDYCFASGLVTLTPGRSYSLIGGPGFKAGPIPVFTGTRTCSIAVLDDETKQPVPIRERICPPDEKPKSTWEKYKFMFE